MPRYLNDVTVNKTSTGKRIYTSAMPIDPIQNTIEYTYTTRMGDRWDTIAFKYLKSAALWYVIANANNGLNGSIFIKPGTTIIIPQDY
jgi:nucleoid-associated protein YgaU